MYLHVMEPPVLERQAEVPPAEEQEKALETSLPPLSVLVELGSALLTTTSVTRNAGSQKTGQKSIVLSCPGLVRSTTQLNNPTGFAGTRYRQPPR
jgi:hypothetical protein